MAKPTELSVLYLEDDADTRAMVTFILERSNIEVVVAETAAEAWDLATDRSFDLYLLDGLLPNGNSLDLCRDLRKYAPCKPIVFYTALAFQGDIEKGMAAGANAYLVKPYFGNLSQTVLETVRGSRYFAAN